MRLVLLGENAIRIEPAPAPLSIDAGPEDEPYNSFHMLAGGFALCTWSVLASWAGHAEVDTHDLAIDVRWVFADEPRRIRAIDLELRWPSLPAERRPAAERAAMLCPIHATLMHAPTVSITAVAR